MKMPEYFKIPTALDRELILRYTRPMGGHLSCEYAFANLLAWGELYQISFREACGKLWVYNGQEDYLYFPLGGISSPEELKDASAMIRRQGFSGVIDQVPSEWVIAHEAELTSFFEFKMDDRFWDYIYSAEKLATLPGEYLSKKRNLLRQFESLYPDWTTELLDPVDASRWMTDFVCAWAGSAGRDGGSVDEDLEALETVFKVWDDGGFEGRVIRVSGEPAAFCIYSVPTDDMAVIHFEKALRAFKGGSQIINRETARYLCSRNIRWINREQDLGVPGLRQAKQSYAPEKMLDVGFMIPRL